MTKTWSLPGQSLCSKEGGVRSIVYGNNHKNKINMIHAMDAIGIHESI